MPIKIRTFGRIMEKVYRYIVAGHVFDIILPEGFSSEKYLGPYEPFICNDDVEPLFRVSLKTVSTLESVDTGNVRMCLNDESPYLWLFEKEENHFNFGFSTTKSHPDAILIPSADSTSNILYVSESRADRIAEYVLSNAMMLLYTVCTSAYQTLMVHASVVSYDGAGYMFLGRSGTGKSTHSRLWLENIAGAGLLNDDNPVVRFIDGQAVVYGTPWSGKTPCYKNQSIPLKAIVRLSQAPHNRIQRLPALRAFASLMPSCSCMRWDSEEISQLHKTVEKVIGVVPCYHLECLPDADAALLCHSTVKR